MAVPGGLSLVTMNAVNLTQAATASTPQEMQPPQKKKIMNKRSTNPKQASDLQVITETLISPGLITGVDCEDNPAKKRENSHFSCLLHNF